MSDASLIQSSVDDSAWNASVPQPVIWPPEGVLFNRTLLAEVLKPISKERIFTIFKSGPDPQGRPFKFAKVPVNKHGISLKGEWQKDESQKLTLDEAMDGAEALVKRSGGKGFGVGMVFTRTKGCYDGFKDAYPAAIDIDGCRNPESGELCPEVRRILEEEELNDTYWEVSPSGRGIRGLCFVQELDKLPDTKVTIEGTEVGFEIFSMSKWVTLTGEVA